MFPVAGPTKTAVRRVRRITRGNRPVKAKKRKENTSKHNISKGTKGLAETDSYDDEEK